MSLEYLAQFLDIVQCIALFEKMISRTKKQDHPIIYVRGLKKGDMKAILDLILERQRFSNNTSTLSFHFKKNDLWNSKGAPIATSEQIEIQSQGPRSRGGQ